MLVSILLFFIDFLQNPRMNESMHSLLLTNYESANDRIYEIKYFNIKNIDR
jgi:hypothetical protein